MRLDSSSGEVGKENIHREATEEAEEGEEILGQSSRDDLRDPRNWLLVLLHLFFSSYC